MALVLALAALFVYLRVRSDLDKTINDGLRSRADIVAGLVRQTDTGLSQGRFDRVAAVEDNLAQVLTADGRVLDASPGAGRPALDPARLDQSLHRAVIFDSQGVLGLEGDARVLARPVAAQERRLVVVVGASIDDRNEALRGLVQAFAIGGPIAVLLASGIGYLVVSLALSPVEAMRRRAERITLQGEDERLPLPDAEDEIHRLGETLNSMLARLEATIERERKFVADASHELRTPIAVLRAEIEVAMRSGRYDDSVRDALLSAIEEADRLARMAEDLLVIARADAGRLPMEPEDVRLAELLESARRRFVAEAQELGREIVLDVQPTTARLDPRRVEQAIDNLLDNALRHGDGTVRLSAERDDGNLEIAVCDEGKGFSADLKERAFERFSRADSSRGEAGAGLGLAIVQAIAVSHGGRVEVADDDRGACVRVTLPLASA